MGSAVQYRDLPGGPAELKFCDELSRFCLCTNCGMLSMSMLQDTNRHMFCETCLVEASEKHHREHIYCKFEKNHVSIFEMFEAIDLITVIRDQYVLCPNTRCATALTLGELKKHYTQCQPTVTCWTCDRQVETADWDKHIKDCNKPGAGRTPQKATKETQVRPKYGVLSPGPSPSVNMDSNRNNSGAYGSMNTASVLHQAQMLPPANEGPELTTQCPYCARKVKEKNLENHVTKCQKAPLACVYCEKEFSREETKSHLAVCERNPDNVPQKVPEKREKALNKQPTCPPQAPGGNRLSYADVAKTGTAAGRNPATGPRQHSQVHSQSSEAQCIQTQPRASYSAHAAYDEAASENFRDANSEMDECYPCGLVCCCPGVADEQGCCESIACCSLKIFRLDSCCRCGCCGCCRYCCKCG